MLVLRFKDKSHREWKVPFNINLGGNELPIGLGAIAALLFSIAGINLITKQVATVSGVLFTLGAGLQHAGPLAKSPGVDPHRKARPGSDDGPGDERS